MAASVATTTEEWHPLRSHPLGPPAARLAAAGYQLVLVGASKRPLFLRSLQEHGLRDATDDLIELERRLAAARGAARGLAVAAGGPSGPIVLDADGPCAVRVVESLLGPALELTPREKTSHGAHFLFAPDPTVPRRTRQPGDRLPDCGHTKACWVDVLGTAVSGAPGQIVVVWPSPGREWVWPEGGLPPVESLPELPTAVRSALVPVRPAPRLVPTRITAAARREARRILGDRLAEACAEVERAEPGTRHDVLLRVARRLGSLAGAAGVAPGSPEAEALADELARASIASGHDPRDAERTAADGLAWGLSHPVPPPPRGGGAAVRAAQEREADARLAAGLAQVEPVAGSEAQLRAAEDRVAEVVARAIGPGAVADCTLLAASTGTGKTRAEAGAAARAGSDGWWPVLACVGSRQLSEELSEAAGTVGAPPAELERWFGRRPVGLEAARERADALARGVRAAHLPVEPGECAMYEAAATVGQARHSPGATLCRSCVHGLGHFARSGAGLRAAEARRRLAELRIDPRDVPPCGHLAQQEPARAAAALVVVAPTGQVSEAMLESDHGPRAILCDDLPDSAFVSEVTVSMAAAAEWVAAARTQLAQLRRATARGDATPDELAQAEGGVEATVAFARLLLDAAPDDGQLVAPLDELEAVAERLAAAAELAEVGQGGAAPWERVGLRWRDQRLAELRAPLRAAPELAFAVQAGAARVEQGQVRACVLTPLARAILRRDRPTLILDATPSPVVLGLVERAGGHVERAVVEQGTLLVDPAPGWRRGHPRDQERRAREGGERLMAVVPRWAAQVGTAPARVALGVPKPWLAVLEAHGSSAPTVSWGAERGTNGLEGCATMVVAGPPGLPRGEHRRAYLRWRAALRLYDAALGRPPADEAPDWPADEAWELVEVGGVRCTRPAPPELARWVTAADERAVAQMVGRLRGARRPEGFVALGLGLPVTAEGMQKYGIQVLALDQPACARAPTPRERGAAQRAQAELRVAAVWLDAGALLSFRATARALRAEAGTGVGHEAWRRARQRLMSEAHGDLERLVGLLASEVAEGEQIVATRDDLPEAARSALARARVRAEAERCDARRGGEPIDEACVRRAQGSGGLGAHAPPAA